MSTLTARSPYTQDELKRLYPENLELQLVQVLLRHGERTPVSARFSNAGLHAYWPYCNAARQLKSVILGSTDYTNWDALEYRRRLETFNANDSPVAASGPHGEVDSLCQPGELTDKGRETTLALGQRLRHLYVDQLKFLPGTIENADLIYLRATPIPRALESVQQAFWGLYPCAARAADFPPPTIYTRAPADETLYPNEYNCKRFGQLAREFGQRAADRWNESDDMKYLNKVLGKWMPASSPRIAVDSHPRLSGIMDTINSTKAHGPATKLPKEFYDEKASTIIDKIAVEEWFAGYTESREYRMLGIGGLMGDIVERMTASSDRNGGGWFANRGESDGRLEKGRGGETGIKVALSGCHDTTLAGILQSLGAFDNEKWPPYSSHIAFELFRNKQGTPVPLELVHGVKEDSSRTAEQPKKTWWQSIFGTPTELLVGKSHKVEGIFRKPSEALSEQGKAQLNGYFVRIRYNDKVMQVPACKLPGNHLSGDESLCTLAAFKNVVDKYTPKNWKAACGENLGTTAFPTQLELSGH